VNNMKEGTKELIFHTILIWSAFFIGYAIGKGWI